MHMYTQDELDLLLMPDHETMKDVPGAVVDNDNTRSELRKMISDRREEIVGNEVSSDLAKQMERSSEKFILR